MIKEEAEQVYKAHEENYLVWVKQNQDKEAGRTISGFDFDLTINELELRNRFEVEPMPLDILKQKYLVQKGQLFLAFKEEEDAYNAFCKCLKTGQMIDLRIKLECLRAIKEI